MVTEGSFEAHRPAREPARERVHQKARQGVDRWSYRCARRGAAGDARSGGGQRTAWRVAASGVMVMGAGLVAWSAGIHLDLWHDGYRGIATIGPLFLAQAVVGYVLAVTIAVTRRALPALAGAGFLAGTAGALVVSAERGLFGFQDSLGAPFAHLSLAVESAGIVVLGAAATLRVVVGNPSRRAARSGRGGGQDTAPLRGQSGPTRQSAEGGHL